jgi:hypothetical protein
MDPAGRVGGGFRVGHRGQSGWRGFAAFLAEQSQAQQPPGRPGSSRRKAASDSRQAPL